jgi:hypothetical protein
MYCTQCGTNLPIDAAFCSACGAAVRHSAPSRPVTQNVVADMASTSPSKLVPLAPLQCPTCGLLAPANAALCDCGFDFTPAPAAPSHRSTVSETQGGARAQFASIAGPAQWAKWLLFATLVMSSIGILSGLAQVELLSRAVNGISEAEAAANDSRQQAIGGLQLLLLVATAIAFLTWFYRAHRNLAVVSSIKPVYTSGWAIGGFFVPFLNLVRPLQVMRELWHGSLSTSGRPAEQSGSSKHFTSTPALVGWWWAMFFASGVLGNQTMRLSFKQNPTLSDLEMLSWLQILSDACDIPGALLAITLIGTITARQLNVLSKVSEGSANIPQQALGNPA